MSLKCSINVYFLIVLLGFNQFSVFIAFAQIRAAIEQLEGPQPMDVRLMKKRTGEPWRTVDFSSAKPVTTGPTCFCPNAFCHSNFLKSEHLDYSEFKILMVRMLF